MLVICLLALTNTNYSHAVLQPIINIPMHWLAKNGTKHSSSLYLPILNYLWLRHNPLTKLPIWELHTCSHFSYFKHSCVIGPIYSKLLPFCFSYFSAFIQMNSIQRFDCPLTPGTIRSERLHAHKRQFDFVLL